MFESFTRYEVSKIMFPEITPTHIKILLHIECPKDLTDVADLNVMPSRSSSESMLDLLEIGKGVYKAVDSL